MQQPNLLPGGFSSPRRRANFDFVLVAVFLFVFAGAGYFLWQKLATTRDAPTLGAQVEKNQLTPPPATDPLMEDLAIHFKNAIRSTVHSGELVRQSQARIRQVLPALDRNYLSLERARLEAACSLAEQALREANRASEELEVAQRLTQEKINTGGKQ